MARISLSQDFKAELYTSVENNFFARFFTASDPLDIKIYIYGLYLSGQNAENCTIEKIASDLMLSVSEVKASYKYWQETGIVSIGNEFEITYLTTRTAGLLPKKFNAKKFETFVSEVQRLFCDRLVSENEYLDYFEIIESYKLEINAVLEVIAFCLNKNPKVSTSYIIKVAKSWAEDGLKTEAQFDMRIAEMESNSESLRLIFASLGLKSSPDLDDKQLYLKWTDQWEFDLNAILTAAKYLKKRGGTKKLDSLLLELFRANINTSRQIESYLLEKEALKELASGVVKGIGAYYATLDVVVETYILPWLNKGFSSSVLTKISKYCFTKNIKSLSGVDQFISKLFDEGTISEQAFSKYVENQKILDDKVKNILTLSGSDRVVTFSDREYYKTWSSVWGIPDDIVFYVASLSVDKTFPMPYINKTLATLKEKEIFGLSKAKEFLTRLEEKAGVSFKNEWTVSDAETVSAQMSRDKKLREEAKAEKLLKHLMEEPEFAEIEKARNLTMVELGKASAYGTPTENLENKLKNLDEQRNEWLDAKGIDVTLIKK